jgi:hypothetical protein
MPPFRTDPAGRVVEVRGVAGEQHAALAEGGSHTLVGDVQIPMNNLIWALRRKELLQPLLDGRIAEQFLLRLR